MADAARQSEGDRGVTDPSSDSAVIRKLPAETTIGSPFAGKPVEAWGRLSATPLIGGPIKAASGSRSERD
jgi:hypothetical protein